MAEAERFGRYQLIRVVGTGGMAQVHLARQVGPEGFVKPCVLKRIAAEHASNAKVRKMFLDEARLSALLNHPNIVQTFDFGDVDGVPFMAMELVDGVNLSQLCRALATSAVWLPLRVSMEITIAVADALDYAHTLKDIDAGQSLNVVHRDVSPQNILVSRQGSVKLADFGIARHEARQAKTVGASSKGKPGYMAPEQAFSAAVDGRADIFSLGVVLTELVTARRLMRELNDRLVLPQRIRDLVALRDDTPPALLDLLLSMTADEPDSRPKSAREVAHALRKLVAELPDRGTLGAFFEATFAQFFPPDAAGGSPVAIVGKTDLSLKSDVPNAGATENPGATVPARPEKPTLRPTEALKKEFPAPPQAQSEDLAFVDTEWVEEADDEDSDVKTSASAVYGGWPEQYIEKEEPPAAIQLVTRSSTVDAMQFFKAQGSSSPPPDAAPADGGAPEPGPPIFGAPAKDGLPHLAPRGLPKVLLGQSTPEDDAARAEALARRRKILLYSKLVAAGLVVGGLCLGIVSVITKRTERRAVGPARTGKLAVSTSLPGARIFLDGIDTGRSTPGELEGLALDKPLKIAVRLPGYLSIPSEVSIVVPSSTEKTSVGFTLRRGRTFQIETQPEGASVAVNGRTLPEATPLALAPLAFGATATLTVSLQGYIPARLVLVSNAQTATVAKLTLELGREIDVVSEPAGARVFVDGVERGLTPAYDLLVPDGRKFKVKALKRGFKPWTKTLGKNDKERLIELELEPLPLLAMPMSKEDKKEARDWDRRLTKLASDVRRARGRVATAEKHLAQAESSPNFFVGRLTNAQREVDEARSKLEDLEAQLGEVETQVDTFRQKIMNQLEGVNEEN